MPDFDSFVVFAEMRTGSNFLESNLNALAGVRCHGEAFNPHFIGYPNRDALLGLTRAGRDAAPERLLEAIRGGDGLQGFRFFGDHEPRLTDRLLAEPGIAKIILTRNPIDSYVSHKIAAATGQWKLTNVSHARVSKVRFDAAEFETHLRRLQAMQLRILGALQRSGQSGFYLDYDDLQDVSVMNGLAAWLGVAARLDKLDTRLKKQNPGSLADKLENFDEIAPALARLDLFELSRTPNFEPRRGPMVPGYVAAARSGLLLMPLRSGPVAVLRDWLRAVDGAAPRDGFTQNTLRQWKAAHPGHRSFAVLRHPVARAHAAFCDRILARGPGSFGEIRATLRRSFKLPISDSQPGPDPDPERHRAGFLGFLGFLKANLAGQTNVRVDPAWASQIALLRGVAGFGPPDALLREDRLRADLPWIAAQVGVTSPPLPAITDPHAALLARIYDSGIESATRAAYGGDYESFGFADWTP